jgi:FkbM family methyltransferase
MATNKIRKAVAARHTSAPAFWWRKITRVRSVRIDGFTVEVDQERIGYTATKALWRGTYEEAERFLVRKVLRPGDRVVEAGAGLGVVTMNIAKVVGEGNLVVYEASPVTAELLERNLERNGFRIEVRRRGLSDSDAGTQFVHAENIRGSSSVAKRDGQSMDIATDEISRVLADFRANTLVLDIEGKEIDVLLKAPLQSIEKIIVEIHPRHLGDAPYLALYRRLFDSGFVLRHELSLDDVLFFERLTDV